MAPDIAPEPTINIVWCMEKVKKCWAMGPKINKLQKQKYHSKMNENSNLDAIFVWGTLPTISQPLPCPC